MRESIASSRKLTAEYRKHPRFETALPIHFNLNPDYHYVPEIRKMGVGGTIRNLSSKGLRLDSRLDLLDVCQIFPEEMRADSPFELEVILTDPRERRQLIKGSVRWYRVSKSNGGVRHFEAGLYLRDHESSTVAKAMVESITESAMA